MRIPQLTQMDIHSDEYDPHAHHIHFALGRCVAGRVIKRSPDCSVNPRREAFVREKVSLLFFVFF